MVPFDSFERHLFTVGRSCDGGGCHMMGKSRKIVFIKFPKNLNLMILITINKVVSGFDFFVMFIFMGSRCDISSASSKIT